MANWLDRFLPPGTGKAIAKAINSVNLPAAQVRRDQLPGAVRPPVPTEPLPNASLIYGIATGILFAVGVYFLITGLWFTGLLLLFPAGCFLGFAVYFLRHKD